MKVKFVTCIYTGLDHTYMGGRPSRFAMRYKMSLLCLVNSMKNADFICYASSNDIDALREFFYNHELISEHRLKFVEYPLETSLFSSRLKELRSSLVLPKTDRCHELQYMKLNWVMNEDGSYDRYYWIDAGLSHCGLIPPEYRILGGWEFPNGNPTREYEQRQYYDSIMFQPPFLDSLLEKTGDKFLVCGKENISDRWSGPLPDKYYSGEGLNSHGHPYNDVHVVGGLFGGSFDKWQQITPIFNQTIDSLLSETASNSDIKGFFDEEAILSYVYAHHKDWFNVLHFDRWGSDPTRGKVFYQLLEDLRFPNNKG